MYGKIDRAASGENYFGITPCQMFTYIVICNVGYATEACPLLSRDKQSLEFTFRPTHLFMKIFRTASPAVVIECQRIFGFMQSRMLRYTAQV